ncbi:MAG: hypothetical protein A2V70_02865 [Planctomycetes bacterium RBG_13_63_9]|nr:MAG: hypothetical protein A2V70_02865 [Planctomycetes bacterium RBG_13_63_9]
MSVVLFAASAGFPSDGPVMELRLPRQKPSEVGPVQDRIYRAAENQARYLLTLVHPWQEDPGLLLMTQSKSGEHWIRPNTGAIEGLAFLYRFGPYDEKAVGLSRRALLERILLPMIRYCVVTHRTGDRATSDGKPWGDAWQSAHWAQMLGHAAWWIWEDLPDDLRHGVRRVVAHEADRIAVATPPHQLRRDTKAEENAWNSQILSVAVLLLPEDPRRPLWQQAFQRWVLSAHLRPADETSQTIVDGRTLAEQFTGANVFDDYTMENHGFVHPDYMTCFSLSLGCSLHYRLTGRPMPEALLHNVSGMYENLKWFALPDGGFVYPNGQDWELFRNPVWHYTHLLMAVYAADADAWSLMASSLDTLEEMQRRHASGRVYGPDESFFASAPTDLFRYLGRSWLVLEAAETIRDAPRPRLGVRRLDSAMVVLNRTPKAAHSLSWGAKIMAMCVPLRLDRVVSPHQSSGIGHIRVEDRKKPLPVSLADVRVENNGESFTADLVVDHGKDQVRAELHVESDADGSLTLSERLVAAADLTTVEVATGLIGVLNNRNWVYEKGKRRITIDEEQVTVPALSGKDFAREGSKRLDLDSVLRIESEGPLDVRYLGATRAERGRATDELYLNYLGGKRSWRRGQTISATKVRISCPAD